MSCNGCQALREGCNENCILRQSLHGIKNHQAQANATVFAAKFFGRAGLMYLLSSVPESQRPALFQSLLFEACGRTVNPVNGAVGLLWTGNWHVCQSAVETVLGGGALLQISKSPAEGASDTNNINLFGSQDHLRFSRTQNNGQELTTERQNLSAMNMKSMLNYENLQMMMSERGSGQRMRRIEREQRCMTTTWEGRYFCGIRFGTRKKTRPSMIKVTSLVPVVETAGLGASEGSVVT